MVMTVETFISPVLVAVWAWAAFSWAERRGR